MDQCIESGVASDHTADSVWDPNDHGLSPKQIEQLRLQRETLLDELAATPAGREIVRNADWQISSNGTSIAADIRALGREARGEPSPNGSDRLRSKSAAVVLNELTRLCHREAAPDLYAHRSRLYAMAQKGHAWMDRRMRSGSPKRQAKWAVFFAGPWGFLSNLATLAASLVLFFGYFEVAAALIGARVLVTAIVWSGSSYPSDDSPDTPVLDADPRICVLGHAGDMFLFASFAVGLINTEHVLAAFLVISASCIMILGTLMRIAASAGGFPVPRLHLERMVRGGSTFAAITLASVDQVAWWWAPAVLILFPTVFAFIETQEALRALKLKSDSFGRASGADSTPIWLGAGDDPATVG